jgi:hypothetical protein
MWIGSVLEHSQRELELLGLNHVGIDTVVTDFIKGLHAKLGNQPGAMKTITNYVEQLIDKKPIAPITEADFDPMVASGRLGAYTSPETVAVVAVSVPTLAVPWTSKLNSGLLVPTPTFEVAMTFVALGVALVKSK